MKALIMLDEQGGKHLASSSFFLNINYTVLIWFSFDF